MPPSKPAPGAAASLAWRGRSPCYGLAVLQFLSIVAWLFLLCLLAYGAATLPLRVLEFAVGRRFSRHRPGAAAYFKAQALAVVGNAIFTPALCYVTAGLVFKAGKFTDPDAFSQSAWFWGASWVAGLLLPVQFHYTLNRRLHSADAEQTVQPAWLMAYWGVNSLASATLMWLPLWLGLVSLSPPW